MATWRTAMGERCEFCGAPPVRKLRPASEGVYAAYGVRLSCMRHLHWVRRLIFLDTGTKRLGEDPA